MKNTVNGTEGERDAQVAYGEWRMASVQTMAGREAYDATNEHPDSAADLTTRLTREAPAA
jgi:hypothetical protein